MTRPAPSALPDDRVRFLHMRDAAAQALEFIKGRTREDLETDAMLRRALTSCVQEIGEAGARMSDLGRARAPDIPWTKIVGSRHILVHAYFNVDLDVVWRIATQHLPALLVQVTEALNTWPGDQPGA